MQKVKNLNYFINYFLNNYVKKNYQISRPIVNSLIFSAVVVGRIFLCQSSKRSCVFKCLFKLPVLPITEWKVFLHILHSNENFSSGNLTYWSTNSITNLNYSWSLICNIWNCCMSKIEWAKKFLVDFSRFSISRFY